eukprot:c18642_g1_i1 orf=421-1467(+)
MGAPAPSPEEPHSTTKLDIVVVVLIALGGAMMILGNAVILYYRSYRPIKSKSVQLTLLSSVGGLIWISSSLVVNDHFARKKALALCALWTYWLQACFGFGLWLNCLTLRLITLYRIFICKCDTTTYDYAFIIPLLLPIIAICIGGTVKKNLRFQYGYGQKGYCKFEKLAPLDYGLIALVAIYFIIFVGFSFKLRKAMAQFNEFRLIRRGGILSLFLFLLWLVTLSTQSYEKPVGRCLLSSAVASAIFYYFWARNGVVIINVLFNQDKYREKFNADVRRSPSQHERKKSSGANLKMLAQLEEVRTQVKIYKDRIDQLEEEVKALEQEYSARQQKTSSQSSPNGREIELC